MDTICSLLRVVEYTCISVWLSNDYSSKSLHIKYIFLQCILLFFYFFHSILLCLTWYICPSLAWQEESRFSLLVNQVRFISISVLIFHDANFLFWYMSIIQFDLILHISVKFRKSPPAWPFHSHEWPGHNFSLQYQYIIKQTTDQNSEKTINQVIIIWSNTKPQNKLHKKYMTDSKEKFHQDIGNERADYVIIVFGVS